MQLRARLAAIAILGFASLALSGGVPAAGKTPAPETRNSHCPYNSKDQVEITGIIRNMMTGHAEPQEQINSYFDLVTTGKPCGDGRIMVFAPGITPCFDGDRATIKGNYYAPDERFIDIAMMDAWEVKCGSQ